MNPYIEIGVIGKPFGMEGAVKFRGEPIIDDLERVHLEGMGYRSIEDLHYNNQECILQLSGITDRTAAERLAGIKVQVNPQDLPPLEEGAYYFFELKGLPVWVDGKPFGEVIDVEDAGAQDLLIIKASGQSLRAQSKSYMVPIQAPYTHLERVAGRFERVSIDAVAGLFDL